MAAEQARTFDPQLAATYKRLIAADRHHDSSMCHIATIPLTQIATCWRLGEPYQIRDLDSAPLTMAQSKQIVTEHHQVPKKNTPNIHRWAVPTHSPAQLLTEVTAGASGSVERRAPCALKGESLRTCQGGSPLMCRDSSWMWDKNWVQVLRPHPGFKVAFAKNLAPSRRAQLQRPCGLRQIPAVAWVSRSADPGSG
ncbi:MAG: hypothetical protein ACOH1Y_12960 [Propionicimonas sp.]